ncbi:hypothetical protein RSK20926_04452 [Roseobacter sp. SK209-2-6]|uniref:hypothetical protein n=1 Tax=Roseobacter sp. SK209-2-6 TaxID=388739 RepID=UPI0000F3D38D|nr:hypothetical protein [Roseobacter sp. SK209-2-6]EBA15104.1 hypothetical protein RSK20926_04452 [Roseobacter sp. SK209-2-6]
MKTGGLTPFLAALEALPQGSFTGHAQGRRYQILRQSFARGKAEKLVAYELGGSDYISLNLYHLEAGPILKPCEMPVQKVIDFTCALTPDG